MLEFTFDVNIHTVCAVVDEFSELSDKMLFELAAFYGDDFVASRREHNKLYSYYLLMKIIKTKNIHIDLPLIFNFNEHGKPLLQNCDIHFNISHSEKLCAAAVSTSPVGIDVQLIKPAKPATVSYACTERERAIIAAADDYDRAFIQYWTYKESYLKAVGCGLRRDLPACEFDIDGNILTDECEYKTYKLNLPFYSNYCGAITVYKKIIYY